MTVAELVDDFLLAYNAARLREAAQLLAHRILEPDVTVGLALSGAITPTGLGTAALVPMIPTIALPIMAAYALSTRTARPLRRLYEHRDELLDGLRRAYQRHRPSDPTEVPQHAHDTAAGHAVGRSTPHTEESS